jgi:hypothetical protein
MDSLSPSPVPSNSSQISASQFVSIDRCDRWQAYHRLQELGIACTCLANGCLQVEIENSIAALQLWSVFQNLTASRRLLANRLERCWSLPASGDGEV